MAGRRTTLALTTPAIQLGSGSMLDHRLKAGDGEGG
jgi:hypothetical protein